MAVEGSDSPGSSLKAHKDPCSCAPMEAGCIRAGYKTCLHCPCVTVWAGMEDVRVGEVIEALASASERQAKCDQAGFPARKS